MLFISKHQQNQKQEISHTHIHTHTTHFNQFIVYKLYITIYTELILHSCYHYVYTIQSYFFPTNLYRSPHFYSSHILLNIPSGNIYIDMFYIYMISFGFSFLF